MMKKKMQILVTFILALAVSVGLFAGCGGKEKVTVDNLKATETVEVGKSKTLSATASDGSELEWSSSNEQIATVTEKGRVTGVKAGKATVTAKVKGGKAKATCEVTVFDTVTFVFTKEDGTKVTSLNLEWEQTVQLGATASDGSTVTSWQSLNPDVVTVSETGLVTAIGLGETEITVKTSTNAGGRLSVTVGNSTDPNKYAITTDEAEGKWFYSAREDGGREFTLGEARFNEGVATFEVKDGEWNWTKDSMTLSLVDNSIGNEEWHKLTMKINSNVAASVTVHTTNVNLKAGDNEVTVYYQQWNGKAIVIWFQGEGPAVNAIKLVISDYAWEEWTPVALNTPSFTLSGDDVTVTDTNAEGVKEYEIGLFKDGEEEPAINRFISGKSGKIDTSTVEGKNGTYTVQIRAKALPGFNDSEWSAVNDYTYTIDNADVVYDLTQGTNPQKKGGGAAAAMTSGRWEYAITDSAEGVSFNSASYENGTVTLDVNNGWAFDCAQLLRHYSEYAEGTELTVKMTLTSTRSGKIFVCGNIVEMVANVPRTVEFTVTQKSDEPTIVIFLNTLAEDDSEWPGKLLADGSLGVGQVTFTVSDVTVTRKAA